MKKHTGFTLVELMITLTIVGALLTIGVPSLKDFMKRNQLIAATNELLSALHVARSEAIKLNKSVTVCESSNGTSCTNRTLPTASSNWEKGWIVLADSNRDALGTGTVCTSTTTDCLLRTHEKIDDSDLVIEALNQDSNKVGTFTFTSRGLPKDASGIAQSGVFSICSKDADGNEIFRSVVLSFSGRARVTDDAAVKTCP